jgi:alpha,alpha-trehalose phosphorylase
VWQALVCGFGGVRDYGGELSIDPRLPREWSSLAYSLRFRQRQLRVELTHEEERFVLDHGDPLELTIRDRPHRLEANVPLVLRPD